MSTDPAFPKMPRPRCFGVLICSRPPANSTRVCSATRTSTSRDELLGNTSTTVSLRLLAVIRMCATATSKFKVMGGSGVLNVGMVILPMRLSRLMKEGGAKDEAGVSAPSR